MVLAVALVEFLEPFAQTVRLNASNSVFAGVEDRLGTFKDFGSDIIFVKLVNLAQKVFFAEVAHQPHQPGRSGERRSNRFQFSAFFIAI